MTATYSAHLQIAPTPLEAADQCAAFILKALAETLQSAPRASLAISGGSTPKLLFAAMAKASFDWSNVHFFWVDERCVPPTDSQSNFKLADDHLLTPAKVPPQNVHRIYGEMPPEEGAARYVLDIKRFFSLSEGALPVFDVLHRGMGPDAHTASLFPGTPLVDNRTGIAAHVWVEKMKMDRVTLLPGVLLAARRTVLQVSGSEKADALRHVLDDAEDLHSYPCQIASRDEKATWFLDQAAAVKL
ncbi:MAG TPA: 6-phosphogluconolactonase [Bryobacteraceae bacterium]|jgi:6-phosphogluconolactonase